MMQEQEACIALPAGAAGQRRLPVATKTASGPWCDMLVCGELHVATSTVLFPSYCAHCQSPTTTWRVEWDGDVDGMDGHIARLALTA